MIRKFLTGIISLTTLMLGGVVFAQTGNIDVMDLPKLEQHVTDFAGVLDAQTLSSLNDHAYNYEQTSGHQFVAVLIPDRQGYELFDIALKIFNDNEIGSAEENDGLLLVIATNEKKIRIAVGYGLEGEMPDVLASKIIEEDIRPMVNSGDYAGAVRAFYRRAEEAIASGEGKKMQPAIDGEGHEALLFALAIFAYSFGKAFRSSRKEKRKKSFSWIPMGGISLLILISAIAVIGFAIPFFVYIVAIFFGYLTGGSFFMFPGGPRGGFSGGSGSSFGGRSGGGGGFSGGFSGGGGSSGGGGAGD